METNMAMQKLILQWQSLLGLRNWNIAFEEADEDGIVYNRHTEQAIIRMQNVDDADMEKMLVAMLLELSLEMVTDMPGENRIYFDRALRRIANIIVALKTNYVSRVQQNITEEATENEKPKTKGKKPNVIN